MWVSIVSITPKLLPRISSLDHFSVAEPLLYGGKIKLLSKDPKGGYGKKHVQSFLKESIHIFISFMTNMLEEILSNNKKLNLVNVLRGNP